MNNKLAIQQGFPDDLRAAAAELYDAAFGAKLSIAIPDSAARIDILAAGFEPDFSFVVISECQLVGIAGFKSEAGSLTGGISFSLLREKLSFWGVLRAVLILGLFERKQIAGQLLMDGIAVSPQMRGRGLGTRLLQRLITYADEEGYRSIRLDVIDTNPAARRLYERVGFVPAGTEHFTYLKWLLGFGAATEMAYILNRLSTGPMAGK